MIVHACRLRMTWRRPTKLRQKLRKLPDAIFPIPPVSGLQLLSVGEIVRFEKWLECVHAASPTDRGITPGHPIRKGDGWLDNWHLP